MKNTVTEESGRSMDPVVTLKVIERLRSIEAQLLAQSNQIARLEEDLTFLKQIFVAKQAKKQKRREQKAKELLAIENAKQERQRRKEYEDLVLWLPHRPWHVLPDPESAFTAKELELVRWVALGYSNTTISKAMNVKEETIAPRLRTIAKRLGLKTREKVIACYLEERAELRNHRWRRCLFIMSRLLNPPAGMIDHPSLVLKWRRSFGKGRTFRLAPPLIPLDEFDRFRPFEHELLKLKLRGMTNEQVAARLKVKEGTLVAYIGQIRSSLKITTGWTLSIEDILRCYKKYRPSRDDR